MSFGSFETAIVVTIFFLNCYFAVRVFFNGPKNPKNYLFSIFALSIAFWVSFAYVSEFFPITNPGLATLFTKLALSSGLVFIASLFLFSTTYLGKTPKIASYLTFALGLTAVILIMFTSTIVEGIEVLNVSFNIVYGYLYNFFFLPIGLLLFGCSVYNFQLAYRKLPANERYHLKLFFWGVGIVVIISLFTSVVLRSYTGSDIFYRVGNYSTILLTIFTYYSLTTKKFLKINIVATELLAVLITLGVLIDLSLSTTFFGICFRTVLLIFVAYGSYNLDRAVRKDIIQRQALEKLANDLKKANEHLKELDKAKDDFLSMASHELNSPLAAIRGYLSMILKDHMGGRLSGVQHKYLTNISISADRLMHLVKDLLNVSRIEQNRIHLIYDQVNINELINQAAAEIKPNVDEKKHKLVVETDKALPTTWCDADRITEIIINLLSNSVKYTDEGGKLMVISKRAGDEIEIIVKDNGFGIPKDSQAKIFQKFEQGNISRDEKKGTGLGLFIVRNLVELHKGRIWLKSEEGKGSEFHFTVPVLDKKPHDSHENEGPVLKLT